MDVQKKQFVHNPTTGEMMEASTYSGKELFWKEDIFWKEELNENIVNKDTSDRQK
ncbi:hypothetical protein PP175_03410 [Aneurinibacillus sp. Ricciae_BoGa-3]|uniref:hypothetical protein n=1 Tax=Aneurinibacillus sp. Ricciae_BoGa-3 TaxID=3022697 RepID=UPI0023409CE2|nr:hypothetical protein [Aneurinibacillus sp. Ricciae_BoGa-3]WCK55053.1 hypothetical protein PP175_03410 [Aneurinibacillus sp. Ricciae_BoGa-3]